MAKEMSARKQRLNQNLLEGMEPSRAIAIYESEKAAAKGGIAAGLSSLVKGAIGKKSEPKSPTAAAIPSGISGDFMKYAIIGIIAIFAIKFLKGK